jgi:hypothetical protein
MATICATLSVGTSQDCSAQSQVGGAGSKIYVLEDRRNLTYVGDYPITDITVGSGIKWLAFDGDLDMNSGGYELAPNDQAGSLITQSVIWQIKLGGTTPELAATQLQTIDKLLQFRQCVVILKHNSDGLYYMYGNADRGLKVSAATKNTGTLLSDQTALSVTFSALQLLTPKLVNMTTAELDALTV